MADHLGVRQAAELLGVPCNRLYVAASKRLLPSDVSPGGKVLFKLVDLKAFQAEETVRKARRDLEKIAAARGLDKLVAKRRQARG